MSLLHVIILAIVQGLAELLPVSSSAHVIVAEKLMGMNPAAPETTLLLVMLHTGTMFSVIVYFWRRWRRAFFQNMADFKKFAVAFVFAVVLTGIVGGVITEGIEKIVLRHVPRAWVEQLFDRLDLIAVALAAVGILILASGLLEKRTGSQESVSSGITSVQASWIGAVQGLCLPFRGFSRSGATISTGMLSGVSKARSEDFSFALAVILTPVAIARETWRLVEAQHGRLGAEAASSLTFSLFGAVFAFLAGLVALKWLSRWLEKGRWYWFGVYCLLAAAAVSFLYHSGY
ncbi:MAG TPA: undecaprenyl-diphosphate phosphatase [Candidatus Acidoferrales bacterium]|jgi:undecaprenyl-diphosphatase|nr:undecaprenyl-diphosphate phosphatase [Candidatus Acidoferrales bacterium]